MIQNNQFTDFLAAITEMEDSFFEEHYEELLALFKIDTENKEAIQEKINYCKTYGLTEEDLIEEDNQSLNLDLSSLELSEKKTEFLLTLIDFGRVINSKTIEHGLYTRIKLRIQKLNPSIKMPSYAHEVGDSGIDVYLPEDVVLNPKSVQIVKLGFKVVIPLGYELQMRARSGNSAKLEYLNLFIANAPGTIDANYRGEVGVILKNIGDTPILLQKDMRIAQMVFAPVVYGTIVEIENVDSYPSERKGNGWGSTGV